jgi:membrane protease YdiL (CAAX protease family)
MRWFSNPRHGIRDLTLAIALGSFFTLWLARKVAVSPEMAGLEMLVWLAVPALFAVLYLTLGRMWSTAGLGLRLRGNGGWFLLAATLPAALAGILLLLNQISGMVMLEPTAMKAGLVAGLSGLGVFAVKNVVEEFVFRGFLTGRFAATRLAGLQGHVLMGLIYASWHLVYWYTLLPQGKIAEVSGLSTHIFVVVGFMALTLQAILLGELRMVTGSIWAGWLLHTMNNAFFAGLVAANAVPRGDFTAMLFTPLDFGLVYAGIMAIIGLAIWRGRVRPMRQPPGDYDL